MKGFPTSVSLMIRWENFTSLPETARQRIFDLVTALIGRLSEYPTQAKKTSEIVLELAQDNILHEECIADAYSDDEDDGCENLFNFNYLLKLNHTGLDALSNFLRGVHLTLSLLPASANMDQKWFVLGRYSHCSEINLQAFSDCSEVRRLRIVELLTELSYIEKTVEWSMRLRNIDLVFHLPSYIPPTTPNQVAKKSVLPPAAPQKAKEIREPSSIAGKRLFFDEDVAPFSMKRVSLMKVCEEHTASCMD